MDPNDIDPLGDPSMAMGRGELQDRAARGVAWTMVHTVVSLPVAFLMNLVIARVLGIVDYGRLAFLSTLMEVAGGVVALGITPGLIQFGSKAHAAGRRDEVASLLSKVQGFKLLVVAPVISVLVLLVAKVDVTLMVLALVFGVLMPAALSGAAACLGIENKTAAGAKIAMVGNLLTQAAVLAVVLTVATPDAIWVARLAMGGAIVGLCFIPISRVYRRAVLRPRFPRKFPPGFWKFAIPAGLSGLIGTLVVSRTEIFFLTWLSTPAAVGTFALAFGLSSHLFAPAQALIGPLFPAISGLREVDAGFVGLAFGRTLRGSSTIVAVLVGMALPALALLVPVLYGAQFAAAGPVVIALGLAGSFLVVASPVTAFVLARLSAKRVLMANAIAVLVDLTLAVGCIPLWGVWGAVVANVGGAATQMGVLLAGELKQLGLAKATAARQATPALVGSLAGVAVWFLVAHAGLPRGVDALVAVIAGAALVLGGLWATRSGLTNEDAEVVRRIVPARFRRAVAPVLRCLTWADG